MSRWRPADPRRAVALALLGCLGVLAACTTAPTSGLSSDALVTESDEPEARKRARIRLELASGYFEQGQTEVALDEVKRSLSADPGYAPAHVLLGLVFMRLNDARLADESFRRALQLNPRDPDALHNYGWFVCQQGQTAQAIDLFDRALASPVYGGQSKTLLAKGVCQLRARQLPEAEGSLSRAYELDPDNPITSYNLAGLLLRRGEVARAQFMARRLNNSELANAETLWLGIRIERQLGDTVAMQQLAQQLQRRFGQSPEWQAYQRGAFDE